KSGRRILDGGPRYFDTISQHSFSLLYFEQNEHHEFECLSLLNNAVHKCPSAHFHNKAERLLVKYLEKHVPFLLHANCFAFSIMHSTHVLRNNAIALEY
ncbi:19656_t:CDS:2, partial [Funneliformis geosporum]